MKTLIFMKFTVVKVLPLIMNIFLKISLIQTNISIYI